MEDILTEFEEKEEMATFEEECALIVIVLISIPFYLIYKLITMPSFNWEREKKNPMFYFVVSFFLGMVIGFIGWQMNESTKLSTANVGVWVKWLGIFMGVVGLLGMFFYRKKNKR